MLALKENNGTSSRFAFWGWAGVFVGLPLAAFPAGCWQICGGRTAVRREEQIDKCHEYGYLAEGLNDECDVF